MTPPGLAAIIEQDHAALHAFMRGDAGPKKQLYSRGDDVTLANPLGPPARGWSAVCARLEEAASTLRDGQELAFERVSQVIADDLAFTVDLEHYRRVRVAGTVEWRNFDLRVTTVFWRESGGWRIVHRHADPITTARPVESVLTE